MIKCWEILEIDYCRKHLRGGRPPKLSALDKLIIMVQYHKEYRVMECVAFDYGVRKSAICDAIHKEEKAFIDELRTKNGNLKLAVLPFAEVQKHV